MERTEYQARIRALKDRESLAFWKALQMSLEDRRAELQLRVNDLFLQGIQLEDARVRLNLIESLLSGRMIDEFIQRMEAQDEAAPPAPDDKITLPK